MDHIQKNGRHIHQIRRELEKHTFDTKRCDLVATGQKIDFNTNSTYRVEDLAIGGFIAFDIEYMFYCTSKDKLSKNNQFVKFSRRLKSGFMVTAFVEVDQYDKETQKTNSGSEFMRYLFATETGELYMLAFHLQLLL